MIAGRKAVPDLNVATVEQFLGGNGVASWMQQSGEALRDYLRSSDTAPVRPSDVTGKAMECPRGARLAYRLWGTILDSHAYTQRYVSDDSSRVDPANPLDVLSWSEAVQRGSLSFKYKGIGSVMRQGVLHRMLKKARSIPVSARPSGDCQRCPRENVPQEPFKPWHFQCPHRSLRDCGLCGCTGWGWPCWFADSRSVARNPAPLPSQEPRATFRAAAACWAMAMAAMGSYQVADVGVRGWVPKT